MKRFLGVLILTLVLPLCFGQQVTMSGTGTIAATSGTINATAGTSASMWAWSNGNTILCSTGNGEVTVCGGTSSYYNGIPYETRKRIMGAPTLATLHQAALHFTRADLAPAGYLKLAHDLGVATDEAAILEAIEHNQLEVFDYQKVDAYLYNQALKLGAKTRWVWKPAREADYNPLRTTSTGQIENVGYVYAKVYSKRLPMQVMATMKAVLECAPHALFLVSDFEVPKPDPFLAVSTESLLEDGKVWIVQVWDEPGFGHSPEPVRTPVDRPSPQQIAALQ